MTRVCLLRSAVCLLGPACLCCVKAAGGLLYQATDARWPLVQQPVQIQTDDNWLIVIVIKLILPSKISILRMFLRRAFDYFSFFYFVQAVSEITLFWHYCTCRETQWNDMADCTRSLTLWKSCSESVLQVSDMKAIEKIQSLQARSTGQTPWITWFY